jgi:hypothetical protein
MQKEFIPYEQALELKELGFDEPCFGEWQNLKTGKNLVVVDEDDRIYDISILGADIKAPLYQQAFRWFRKNHGLYSSIIFKKSYPDNYVTGLEWYIIICGGDGVLFDINGTYTYEEAELACLKKLIEIVKQPKKD